MDYLNLKDELPIHRQKLDNGLDVVVVEKRKVPVVSINLAYKVGSKDEKQGKTGFAHLFEHLMFEGTPRVPKGQFDRLCSSAGGTNNAYTTYDWTAYIMSLPRHQIELGFWLEADRLINYKVNEDVLRTQQKVVSEEIRQTVENQPYARWREVLARNAFSSESSYSWEVHGSINDVVAATLDDATHFHNNFYKPNNATLVLCGDISPKEAFTLAEKYFGKAQKISDEFSRNNFKKEYLKSGTFESIPDNVPMAAVFLNYHCPGFLNDDIYTGEVLTNIASSGKSSRLYESLIYDKQIASSAGAYVDKREYSSIVTFYAIASEPTVPAEQLYEELKKEVELFAQKEVEKEELEKSGNLLTTSAAHELQYSSGVADNVANLALFYDNPEELYTLLDKYNQVNEKDIYRFAAEFFRDDNMVRVDVIPMEL